VAAIGVQVYDVDTGERLSELLLRQARLWDVALSPDDRLLAATEGPGPVRLWEMASGREFSRMATESNGSNVAFTPDGRALLAGKPGGAILFHLPSRRTIGEYRGDAGGTRVFLSRRATPNRRR
jgi:WD40 repeat protein